MNTSERDILDQLLRAASLLRRGQIQAHSPEHHHHHKDEQHHGRHRVLLCLCKSQEGLVQKDLAQHLGIRPQSLSELLAAMEEQGLLRRGKSPDDRRSSRVYLTDQGRQRALALEDARQDFARRWLSPLSPEEQQQLSALLSKLLVHGEEEEPHDHHDKTGH